MKKILIASPTADIKDYCFDKWMENVSKFTYENCELYLCDNSTTRDYYVDIKKRYEHLGNYFNVGRVTPSQFEQFKLTWSHDVSNITIWDTWLRRHIYLD
jgi:hypothetical protein